MSIDAEWEQCFRTNSTYFDCPVSQHAEENFTMYAAIQNPSSITLKD
jgi:hypothetical protein